MPPKKYNLREREAPEDSDSRNHEAPEETEEPDNSKELDNSNESEELDNSEELEDSDESQESDNSDEPENQLKKRSRSSSDNEQPDNQEPTPDEDSDQEPPAKSPCRRNPPRQTRQDPPRKNPPQPPRKNPPQPSRKNPPRESRPNRSLNNNETLYFFQGQLLTKAQLIQKMTQQLLQEMHQKKQTNQNNHPEDSDDDFDFDYGESETDSESDEYDSLDDFIIDEDDDYVDEMTGLIDDSSSSDSDEDQPKGRRTTGALSLPKTPVNLSQSVKNLDDLIKLGQSFEIKPNEEYSVNMRRIKRLAPILQRLQDLIGMTKIKESIADHLIFMLSGLNDKEHMMHAAIYGPPGCGKTSLALILSDIYKALGYSNGKFKIVKRSDLVAGYLGQTTLKTQQAIDAVQGGVLFIDEAYSLGDKEGRDSFAKEMIDCLNQNLSEQRAKFICIIAGYRNELEKCFFASNPGLKRRFPFQYTIEKYNAMQLGQIFQSMLKSQNWTTASDLELSHIEKAVKKHWADFKNQGGDIETLTLRCKMAHSKRVFGQHQVEKRQINQADFDLGLANFVQHKKLNRRGATLGDKKVTKLSREELQDFAKTYAKQMKDAKII